MTNTQEQLRQALTELLVSGMQLDVDETSRRQKVAMTMARVSELHKQLGPHTEPMLLHYLEQRSYQKALDFLNSGEPETEKPQCGH